MECTFNLGMLFPLGTTWWRVLDVDREADTALLITDKAVCRRRYHEIWGPVTWKRCDLRKWLNGEYYENTFSEEEKAAMSDTLLLKQDNPEYKISGGSSTKDRIFLLSIDEANRYFKNDEDRAIGDWWWLRSPGYDDPLAAYVDGYGSIDTGGLYVNDRIAVRPALKINLKSELFQSMIVQKSGKSITIQIPEFIIRENVLVSVNPDIESAEIPEGVKELAKGSFKDLINLTSVTFPSTLKKIGAEAFSGCRKLQTVSGAHGAVAYGKDVFENCRKLEYTKDMFLNTGKLCDSFAEHLDVCGAEELAMVRMYQSGGCWEEKLPKYVTAENADPILTAMTKHLQEKGKAIKKPAEAAAAFVKANVMLLSKETVRAFTEMLEKNKMAGLSEKLKEDPAVKAVINGEQSSTHDADMFKQ